MSHADPEDSKAIVWLLCGFLLLIHFIIGTIPLPF